MATQTATAHPLEPLAPAELARAGELVRGELPEPRFVSVGLHEPPKADYLAWRAGGERPARCALAVVVDDEHCLHELVCDLGANAVIARRALPGLRSPITPSDYEAAAEAVRADAGWREAMRRRGVQDVSLVQIDVLASGGFGLAAQAGAFDEREHVLRGEAAPGGFARAGAGSRSSSSASASTGWPATARASTAPARLAVATLTWPPGRRARLISRRVTAGSSTTSRT